MDENSSAPLQKLSAEARRVLGVLVEKAKTTPENYPLSVAAVITGSNQKSNRSPQMQITEDMAIRALDELRSVGAAREIQGSGRVTKYRHAAYEWMDIESAESAIITELLLRGPQTVGELRTRASRMHAFDDLASVKAVLSKLHEKGLVDAATPPGRGQMFTHCLYTPAEQQHVAARVEKLSGERSGSATGSTSAGAPARSTGSENVSQVDKLLERMDRVNDRIDQLEARIAELES